MGMMEDIKRRLGLVEGYTFNPLGLGVADRIRRAAKGTAQRSMVSRNFTEMERRRLRRGL